MWLVIFYIIRMFKCQILNINIGTIKQNKGWKQLNQCEEKNLETITLSILYTSCFYCFLNYRKHPEFLCIHNTLNDTKKSQLFTNLLLFFM